MKSPDWKPIRRGAVYCSPACGFRCTFAANRAAHIGAKTDAARMGHDWAYRVWENMGWYYAIGKGCCEIHPQLDHARGAITSYTAFLNTSGFQVVTHGSTPMIAFRKAMREAKRKHVVVGRELAVFEGKL